MQTGCAITTNCEALCGMLKTKYGAYLSESPAVCELSLRVLRDKDGYIISTSHGSFETDRPLCEIDRFLFENTVYDPRILALHGGAVEWNGEATLFLAATTGGKTTLTSYLTGRGCGYITDDCILVDRNDFSIYPFSSPIQLRDGGLEVLKKYNAVPDGLQLLEEAPVLRRWVYTPTNCVEKAVPLKRIFFIERNEHENRLVTMQTTERITALMKAPITSYPITGDYLRLLSRLAKTECYLLRYCDMNYVKEIIQNG